MSDYYQSYAKQTNFKKRFPNAHQPSGAQQIVSSNSNLNTNVPIPSTGVYNPNNDRFADRLSKTPDPPSKLSVAV